jgi:hypothetical protein
LYAQLYVAAEELSREEQQHVLAILGHNPVLIGCGRENMKCPSKIPVCTISVVESVELIRVEDQKMNQPPVLGLEMYVKLIRGRGV